MVGLIRQGYACEGTKPEDGYYHLVSVVLNGREASVLPKGQEHAGLDLRKRRRSQPQIKHCTH